MLNIIILYTMCNTLGGGKLFYNALFRLQLANMPFYYRDIKTNQEINNEPFIKLMKLKPRFNLNPMSASVNTRSSHV